MMHRRTMVWLCLVAVLGIGCKRSAADFPPSNLRAIASFNLEFYHNSQANIHVTHEGTIDETNRLVYLSVPADVASPCAPSDGYICPSFFFTCSVSLRKSPHRSIYPFVTL